LDEAAGRSAEMAEFAAGFSKFSVFFGAHSDEIGDTDQLGPTFA